MAGAAAELEAGEGYREAYGVYARRFGASTRTVKRWVADGRAKQDPPPLDDARELKKWWTRRMKQRVPEGILKAAAEGEPLLELPVVRPIEEPPLPQAVPGPPREMRELGEEERGIFQELRRAEERAYHAHAQWLKAVEAQDDDKAAFANRQCTLATENVRRIQKDATEEAVRVRDLIPRAAAEQAIGEFGQELLSRLRGMAGNVAQALGIVLTPAAVAAWDEEIEALNARLQEEVFGEEVE